jgi:GT2 family glycosyltransferase
VDASIIIPTHGRRNTLLATLRALALGPAGPWETIVVDDGSADGTREAVEAMAAQGFPVPFTCVRQDQSGPAAARNRGARMAKGDALIFIDDDILVGPDFVERHRRALGRHPGCWILGRIVQRPEMRKTAFGRYREALWESFHTRHAGEGPVETAGIAAANLSMPRRDFERMQGFDEEVRIASCEDMLLGLKARESGIRILYDASIVGVHNDWATTLESFCERQRLYAVSDVYLWRRLGARSPRVAVINENGPPRWRTDGLLRGAKKRVKSLFATRAGQAILLRTAGVAERVAPDTGVSHFLYDTAVAVAIFRGVREGFRRFPGGGPTTPT